jgi:predicted RNA polymerase sigma factor
MQGGTAAVEQVIREEYSRLIASLVRRFGDIDIAEEAAGEAFVAALEKWPESAYLPVPAAGSPPSRATARLTGSAVRSSATRSTGRPSCTSTTRPSMSARSAPTS